MATDLLGIRSAIPGLRWPPLPKLADAQLLAWVQWLDRSQWLDAAALQAGQISQLAILLKHFEAKSPWVGQRLASQGKGAKHFCESMQAFSGFPVTLRADVQEAGTAFHSTMVPAAHKPVAPKKTSGSTGQPVATYRTALNHLFWMATTVREHLWHGRDPRARLAVVRQTVGKAFDQPSWGSPVGNLFDTGSSHGMPITTDTRLLVQWLLKVQPRYLLIYPSVWQAILDQLPLDHGLNALLQVRTIGETVSADLRQQTQDQLGVGIADTYSSEEAGIIAIQCPHSGLYHTMAEGLIVEVLRPDGSPCATDEIGRVVVTDLLNFASPILRYDIGDYAQRGPACPCGRGAPTFTRILGRYRNLVKLPDGSSHWPLTGFREFGTVANVTQYQLVQKTLALIEVRLAVDGPDLLEDQEKALAAIISRSLGHAFAYQFNYFPGQLPKPASGKFEEFICEA